MDCMRVNRGQVFMYDPLRSVCSIDDKPVKNIKMKGCLQQKERPYLVVSNNKCNASSHVVTVVPITTRDDIKIPVQVKFFFEGRYQVVLVEQICTANIEDLGNYIYTVSDAILDNVINGIMLQVGFDSKPSNMILDNFICELNKIAYKFSEDARKMKLLVNSEQIKEVTDHILKTITENLLDNVNVNAIPENLENSELKLKNSNSKYSIEFMEQILSDYEGLPIIEFMSKYQCPTKKIAANRIYYIRKKLKNMK